MKTSYGEIRDEILELLKHEDVIQATSEAKSPEECYEIAKPYIGTLSFDEFQSSMGVAKTILKNQKMGTLSEADLDMIAGGKGEALTDADLEIRKEIEDFIQKHTRQ